MFVLGGPYDLIAFMNEDDLKLVKEPKVYGIEEFLSQPGFKSPIALSYERRGGDWADAGVQEKAKAIEEHFSAPGSRYFAETFASKADAQARLEELEGLREFTEDNFVFSHLEVMEGAAYEIWCRPLMDE